MNHSFISILLFSIIILYVASDDTPLVVVHYNLTEPNITLSSPNDDENPLPIVDNITTAGDLIKLPFTIVEKEGYYFQGWTDGIYGYETGDSIKVYENITINPVLQKKDDKRKVYVEYYAEIEGKVIDIESFATSNFRRPNSIYLINEYDINIGDVGSHGWTDGVTIYNFGQKYVVHEKNITFTPCWEYRRKLTYSAGDVDGIAGNPNVTFTHWEGRQTDISILTTVTRKGYDNIRWVYNGVIYNQYDRFLMPKHDIIMYALWEAKKYTIVFQNKVNGKSGQNIKIDAKTEDTIIIPEINVENEGYSFEGWKSTKTGKVYLPNEEYVVEGTIPGVGISFEAVWNKK